MEHCGALWIIVGRCGTVVDHCGSLWDRCGSLRVVGDHCGSFRVLVNSTILAFPHGRKVKKTCQT